MLTPAPHYVVPTTMIDVIKHLGLTSSLQLILDAGDPASYDGTSQTWSDVSGNGYNFYRGSGSGSEASDPTFNGVAGRQGAGEYFSSDGGDGFWNTAKHAFPNAWHKDGATFTVLGWVFLAPGSGEVTWLAANCYSTAQIGVNVIIHPLVGSGHPKLEMCNGDSAPLAQSFTPTATDFIVEGAWMFAGISFSEGSGASFGFANGTVSVFSSDTYSSPSASAPSFGMAIWTTPNIGGTGLDTDPAFISDSGTRTNSLMAWNRALSQAEVTSIYNATKAKFGL